MSDNDRSAPRHADLDQAFGGFFKGVGAVLDVLAEVFDPQAPPAGQPPSRASAQQHVIRGLTPIVDVFDEGRDLVIVLELSGVQPEQIRLVVQDDIFALELAREPRSTQEILLPSAVNPSTLQWTYRNGFLEARVEKRADHDN